MLNINMEYVKGVLFVRLKGSLNSNTASKLIDNLIPILINHGIKKLVYNLSGLSSIDEVVTKSLYMGYNTVLNNYGNVLVINNNFRIKYFKEVKDELSALMILNKKGG